MKREEYFCFLQDTSIFVSPVIEKAFDQFLDNEKELYDVLMLFTKKRLNAPLLKPALLRLSYEICGGTNWEKVIPAAAAFELINISSYQANSAFDNKLGVFTRPQKDAQFIASMITREIATTVASKIENNFSHDLSIEVINSLSKSNHNIYLAQHYDLNLLNIKNYENYSNEDLFLEKYFNRCFLGSGIFNGQCAYAGALLANGQPEQIEALKKFGENYGIALQIINDLGDYVPAGIDDLINRSFQDQFSDFKNGRLTLPLYHLLRFGDSIKATKVKNIINLKQFDDKNTLIEITKMLIEEGSIDYAKEQARIYFKKAKKELQKFDESQSKKLLLVMASMILNNKYLFALNKIKTVNNYV